MNFSNPGLLGDEGGVCGGLRPIPTRRFMSMQIVFLIGRLLVCLFVGLVKRPANSSMSSFQTAQGHAFRKLFYAAGAVTASMR